MTAKIEEIKKAIATTFEIPVEKVNNESSTQTIEKWDSIGHINLVMSLEQHLQLSFSVDEIMQMKDFGTICKVVAAKTGA